MLAIRWLYSRFGPFAAFFEGLLLLGLLIGLSAILIPPKPGVNVIRAVGVGAGCLVLLMAIHQVLFRMPSFDVCFAINRVSGSVTFLYSRFVYNIVGALTLAIPLEGSTAKTVGIPIMILIIVVLIGNALTINYGLAQWNSTPGARRDIAKLALRTPVFMLIAGVSLAIRNEAVLTSAELAVSVLAAPLSVELLMLLRKTPRVPGPADDQGSDPLQPVLF